MKKRLKDVQLDYKGPYIPSWGDRAWRTPETCGQVLPAAHLVDMVQSEVFEEEQEQGRDTLYNDLLVPVHIDAQLHALENSDATMGREGVSAESEAYKDPGIWVRDNIYKRARTWEI